MQTLASFHGLSGNGLAKICDKMRVPYPKRGYWAKVQAGKPVGQRTQMPQAENNTPNKWTIRATPKLSCPDIPIDVAETVAQAQAAGEEAVQHLSISSRLRHALVIQWKKDTAGGHRAHPRLSGIRDEIENPQVLNRRLRVLDALFITLEKVGAEIDEKRSSINRFLARFGSNEIEAKVVERLKQVREPIDPKYRNWAMYRDRPWEQKLVGTGTLVLRIENYTDHPYRKEWKDKDTATIEEQLPSIAPAFVMNAYYAGLREKRFAEERERRAAEQQRREEIARQKQIEQKKFDELGQLATQWQKAEVIKDFVQAVERSANGKQMSSELDQWIAWARRKADELDGVYILLQRYRHPDRNDG